MSLAAGGALALAGGAVVLLQEFAVVYPTVTIIVISAAAGLVVGLAVPWIYVLSTGRSGR